MKELSGQRFGRLVCKRFVGRNKQYDAIWSCDCDCGNQHTVRAGVLKNGHTKSCGCLQKEKAKYSHTVHGHYFDKPGSRSKLSRVWSSMKERCSNYNSKSFKNYGGRGISVCEEWQSFESFYKWAMSHGYRKGLTIERKDNSGDYRPENCEWIARKEQNRNKRSNIVLEFNGETKTLIEWSEVTGTDGKNLSQRLRRGWTVKAAFETPVRKRRIYASKVS